MLHTHTTLTTTPIDPNFAALPTYPVVLQLKGADQDVNLFTDRVKGRPIPGLPPINANRVVSFSTAL